MRWLTPRSKTPLKTVGAIVTYTRSSYTRGAGGPVGMEALSWGSGGGEGPTDAHDQTVSSARTPDVSSRGDRVYELWRSLAPSGDALAASGDHPGRAAAAH